MVRDGAGQEGLKARYKPQRDVHSYAVKDKRGRKRQIEKVCARKKSNSTTNSERDERDKERA